jgi:hypothetical protein
MLCGLSGKVFCVTNEWLLISGRENDAGRQHSAAAVAALAVKAAIKVIR